MSLQESIKRMQRKIEQLRSVDKDWSEKYDIFVAYLNQQRNNNTVLPDFQIIENDSKRHLTLRFDGSDFLKSENRPYFDYNLIYSMGKLKVQLKYPSFSKTSGEFEGQSLLFIKEIPVENLDNQNDLKNLAQKEIHSFFEQLSIILTELGIE